MLVVVDELLSTRVNVVTAGRQKLRAPCSVRSRWSFCLRLCTKGASLDVAMFQVTDSVSSVVTCLSERSEARFLR